MSNLIYPLAKQAIANKEIDLNTDTLVLYLVDTADYTYSASHSVLSDLPVAARVAVSGTLTTPTILLGVLDVDNATFPSVTGDVSEAVILYDVTSDNLLAYYDTGITGMPITPDGTDITVTIHASGLFAL